MLDWIGLSRSVSTSKKIGPVDRNCKYESFFLQEQLTGQNILLILDTCSHDKN